MQVEPANAALFRMIVDLATYMYNPAPLMKIHKLVEENTMVHESQSNPTGERISFNDDLSYRWFCLYHFHRLKLCAIIQRLFSIVDLELLPDLCEHFSISVLQMEELGAAKRIAMSSEYALRPVTGPPWDALQISTIMLVSYGTWTRLYNRTNHSNLNAAEYALRMADFVYGSTAHIAEVLHVPTNFYTKALVDRIANASAGGPPLPELSRRGKIPDLTEAFARP